MIALKRISNSLAAAAFSLLLAAIPGVTLAQTAAQRTPTPPSQPSREQPAATSQPSRTVRAGTSSGASSAGRSEGKYVPPEFKLQADTDAAVLLIEPVDIRAQVDEEFRTDITIINPRSLAFQAMTLALQYDPKVLEPLRINTHHSDTFLETKDAQVYSRQGIVIFRGKLNTALTNVEMPLYSIRWRALADTGFTTIKFIPLPSETTGILNKDGNDILGSLETEGDGYLSASVAINNVLAKGGADWMDTRTLKSGLQLSMQHEILGDTFDVGTPIRVDVLLANPEKAPFSVVNIEIEFDPEYLVALDWDRDNWITLGTNVQDGMYKENFLFTYHMANRIINTTGNIIYKMGTLSDKAVRPGPDPLFSILFQVKKPFSSTDIAFRMPASIHDDGTRVTYLGRDVLGDPIQPGDGAKNITIRP